MKCVPGDLAIITKRHSVTANVGRMVHVLHMSSVHGLWWVMAVGMPMTNAMGMSLKKGVVADECLTPIGRPDNGKRTTDGLVQPRPETATRGSVRETSS